MKNVTEATTKELVEFYNANVEAGKEIKKFADRKTAERRVQALIDSLPKEEEKPMTELDQREAEEDARLNEEYGRTHCPACAIHLSNGVDKDGNCQACGHSLINFVKSDGKKSDPERAAIIAQSWLDPETREKRRQRHSVEVDGQEYRSVKQAFEALGLPLAKHIAFRGKLKAEGELTAFEHTWKIVEKTK